MDWEDNKDPLALNELDDDDYSFDEQESTRKCIFPIFCNLHYGRLLLIISKKKKLI